MANIYNVFNTKSEIEFSNFLDKLDLNVNELLNLTYIAENNNISLNDKRTKILELMAGSSTNNYNLCVKQFNNSNKERVLKENDNLSQQLNLNQIMELNDLVVNVAKKLKAPNCMQGIFNIIKTKSNANVANTFLGMVQQSSVNDSNLKFNTDLQVNGQNLAQIIYNLKNDIEMFVNSVECPKEEKNNKEEIKENNELTPYNRIAGIYDINTNTFSELNHGEMHNLTLQDYIDGKIRYGIQNTNQYGLVCYITAIDKGYAYQTMKKIKRKYNDLNIDVFNLEFKTNDGKKIFVKLDSNGHQLFENKNICHFTSEEVKQMIEEEKIRKTIPIEQTISSIKNWIQSVRKPESLKTLIQMIDEYMVVAKNNIQINTLAHLKSIAQSKLNKIENVNPKIEECIAQQVVSDVCEEDTFNGLLNSLKPTMISITVNKETGECDEIYPDNQELISEPNLNLVNGVQSVQPLTLSPTAIDAPILKKPNQASVVSAVTALSSHLNDIKSDSRENNIECLQTINTLLNQISTYFNELLSESSINSSKEEFSQYCKHINSIEELVDIVEMVESLNHNLITGYKNSLYKKLVSYLESIIDEDWSDEPIKLIASTIDENSNETSPKMEAFINHELQLLYKINPQQVLEAIKDYVSSYENEIGSEEYWDGEDEELTEGVLAKSKYNKGQKFINKNTGDISTILDIRYDDNMGFLYNIGTNEGIDSNTGFSRTISTTYPESNIQRYFSPYTEEEYWDGEDEELTEDTVYDHSWYEVEGQKYPKRTKDGVIMDETCSAGATCAAGVSGFAKPLGSKPKKRKKPSVDVEMFKESVMNDIPCAIIIENRKNANNVKYKIIDGKGYLYINEGLVKANTKQLILEAIDDIYNDCLELPVLENFTPYQLEILMEDEMDSNTVITPQEKQKQEQELDNEIKANPQLKVGLTDDTSTSVNANQELIGVDDSDIQNKKYIVKDPITGKIKVANSSQIKVMEKQ